MCGGMFASVSPYVKISSELDALDTGFEPTLPEEAMRIFSNVEADWWIAGGWALDLVAGVTTRDHIDLDVGIFRHDLPGVWAGLSKLELHQALKGDLARMIDPHALTPDTNSIWVKEPGADKWLLELMLNDSSGTEWLYRRDHRVRVPRDRFTVDVGGLRCFRPEIQLLCKAAGLRNRDQADFDTHAPLLDNESRVWLGDALDTAHPGHPWRISPHLRVGQ